VPVQLPSAQLSACSLKARSNLLKITTSVQRVLRSVPKSSPRSLSRAGLVNGARYSLASSKSVEIGMVDLGLF